MAAVGVDAAVEETEPMMKRPTLDEMTQFLQREFPQTACQVLALGEQSATLRHDISDEHLRPGGTVSGPVMMELADVAMYVAVLGAIGLQPLAVTTSLSFNFLRKPAADRALLAECRLIKLGRTLAVGEVSVYSEGLTDPVAHAVGTYAIPPSTTSVTK